MKHILTIIALICLETPGFVLGLYIANHTDYPGIILSISTFILGTFLALLLVGKRIQQLQEICDLQNIQLQQALVHLNEYNTRTLAHLQNIVEEYYKDTQITNYTLQLGKDGTPTLKIGDEEHMIDVDITQLTDLPTILEQAHHKWLTENNQ